jgi:hypothetical protein
LIQKKILLDGEAAFIHGQTMVNCTLFSMMPALMA